MTKSQKTNVAAIILIALLGLAVYANCLGNGFVYDDGLVIENRAFLSSWSNLRYFFSPRYFDYARETTYRPLVTLTYFLDYSLGGPNPFVYHLNSIIFHILSGILFYLFLLYLIPALDKRVPSQSLALLAALLFICHPIQTEAVGGIAFREDILAALFCFASLLFYLKTKLISGRKKLSFYILSVLCYFFALLSKESALPLILIILLIDLCYQKDAQRIRDPVHPFSIKFTDYFGYIGIICVYLFIRFIWMVCPVPPLGAYRELGYLGGSLSALLTTSRIFVSYLGLFLFPLRLTVDHFSKYGLDPSYSFLEPRVLFSLLILGLIFVFIIRSFRYQRILAFSGLWIFIFLLPVSNVLPLNQLMAERYLYLPSIGFCLFLALVLVRFFYLSPNRFIRSIAIVSIILILSLYSLRTITRNRDWKDSFTLWSKTIETSPNSRKAHNNLGIEYNTVGKYEEAIASYKRAIEIDPGHAFAYNNLGKTCNDIGKHEQAIASYKRAIEIDPDYAEAYYNLGNTYNTIGKHEQAIASYKRAIEINPDFAEAYYNLGNTYAAIGKHEQAIASYKRAIEIDLRFAEAYYNLGKTYNTIGKHEQAIASYNRAIEIDPNYVKAHINLALTYYDKKQYTLAIYHCDRAVELSCSAVHPEFLKALEPYR